MLPAGNYLLDTAPEAMASLHPSWAEDIRSRGPWMQEWGMLKAAAPARERAVIVKSCETTMDLARQLAEAGTLNDWGCVVGGVQTGGRGQLRRPWASLPGNLHVSIILPRAPEEGEWATAMGTLLPLVAGHLVCLGLEGHATGLELKWPNDILQNGRKVGGLLIEERNGRSILGLGLNLVGSPPDEAMREDHSASAGNLVTKSLFPTPLTILESLVSRGKSVYATMLDEIPPTRLIAMVESRLAWTGRHVRITEGNDAPYEAVVSGLSSSGGLVVLRDGEETVLYSGSILPT